MSCRGCENLEKEVALLEAKVKELEGNIEFLEEEVEEYSHPLDSLSE